MAYSSNKEYTMSYTFPPDVQQLVAQQIATGNFASEDDVIRTALHTLSDEADDLQAIQEAVNELRSGDPGMLLDKAFAEVRSSTHPTR
jgi:putative addiction module CopG family antidote